MAKVSQVGIHGRMRQRIVTVGRAHTDRISSYLSRRGISRDKHLHALLQSGAITRAQLETAIRGYNKTPSEFAWMSGVDNAVLDRADRVFLAEYGRFPTQDTDFRLNGNYRKICRSLQHDRHYYDQQLEKLTGDDEGNLSMHRAEPVEILEEVRSVQESRGSVWAFGLVLAGGFVSATILGAVIIKAFLSRLVGTGFLVGAAWLALLAAGLALTLPRQSERKLTIRKCSKCGERLSSEYVPEQCPNCAAPFRS